MSLPANIRINASAPFPTLVKGSGPIAILKQNGIWTVALNPGGLALVQTLADPANSYVLVWNALTGAFVDLAIGAVPLSGKVVKTLTAPGPYAALPADDVLIVKQLVAAPFLVNVDWSQRARPLRVVDGKGDAAVNNITITPSAGQSQLAQVNFSYVIRGNGGSIILTPLPDNTGAY